MTSLIIDIGKTNIKLVLFDPGGQELGSWQSKNTARPGPPYPHADTGAIWDWLMDRLQMLSRSHQITTIIPVTHGAAAALIGDQELALPVLDYEFDGPDQISAEFNRIKAPFSETMTPDLPIGLVIAKQLFWQRHEFPKAFAAAKALLPYPQYWAWRLTGNPVTEVTSLGAHSGLWNPVGGTWSSLVVRQGWQDLMPPMLKAFEPAGTIRHEIAQQTGLDPACQVLSGIHDSNASLLPYLAQHAPPFTLVSTGTWTIIMAPGAACDGLNAECDMLANVDVNADAVPTIRFMGGREIETLLDGRPIIDASMDDLEAVIERGCLALPSFAPQSGPFMGMAGSIDGAKPATDAQWSALAGLYAGLMIDHCLTLIGAQGPIFMDGPFAVNKLIAAVVMAVRPEQELYRVDAASAAASGAFLLNGWNSAGTDHRSAGPTVGHRTATQLASPLQAARINRHKRDWHQALGL